MENVLVSNRPRKDNQSLFSFQYFFLSQFLMKSTDSSIIVLWYMVSVFNLFETLDLVTLVANTALLDEFVYVSLKCESY